MGLKQDASFETVVITLGKQASSRTTMFGWRSGFNTEEIANDLKEMIPGLAVLSYCCYHRKAWKLSKKTKQKTGHRRSANHCDENTGDTSFALSPMRLI